MGSMTPIHCRHRPRYFPTDILLRGVKLLDLNYRESPEYDDQKYFPFYYFLGEDHFSRRAKVRQFGPKLGLIGACYMRGCPWPTDWLAWGDVRPPTLDNLKLFAKPGAEVSVSISEPEPDGSADLMLVTEETADLERFWGHLSAEGWLVVDYIREAAVGDAFGRLCRAKNREPVVIADTRYGVGLVKKEQ